MTREQAIEILNRDDKYMRSGYFCINDFLAIEVLKQESFMNKPCVSAEVCEHDKVQVLDKIRAEIKALNQAPTAFDVVDGNPIKDAVWETLADVVKIIDKYRNGE